MKFAILLVMFAISLHQGVTGVPLNDPNDIENQKANARNIDKLLEKTITQQLLERLHIQQEILYQKTSAKWTEIINGVKDFFIQKLSDLEHKIRKDQPVSLNVTSDDKTQANPTQTVPTLDESTVNQEFTTGVYVSTNDNKNEKSEDNKNPLTSESTESSDKTKENVTQNPVTNAAPDEYDEDKLSFSDHILPLKIYT